MNNNLKGMLMCFWSTLLPKYMYFYVYIKSFVAIKLLRYWQH